MRAIFWAPALAGVLVAGCNSLDVGDLNDPGLETLQENPTPSVVRVATTGLLVGTRTNFDEQNEYNVLLGILGRELYNVDPADPRFIVEMLIGPLDGTSPAFGGNLWADPYANIRNANLVLNAVDIVPGMADDEKEGIRGFAQTIQAFDFLQVINTRDEFGAPIDVDLAPTADPAPVVSRAEVFARIIQLLDEAQTHLQAGGAAFGFALSSGFTGFDTPATFIRFNRALRARVAVYLGDYAGALTFLSQSFLDPAAAFSLGAYHVFSTGSGDAVNQLFDPTGRAILAHPSILEEAQLRGDGSRDLRTAKVAVVPTRTVQGITDSLVFTVYGSNTAPIPFIRNEELILLRAEANIGLGDLVSAAADINLVRVNAGGLPPVAAFASQDAALTELLYNKRYSLLFEGGHRWIDLRRYGRLGTLPLAVSTHTRIPRFPFPVDECNARGQMPAQACQPVPGS